MTAEQFRTFQDTLGLNNRELAIKLSRDPTAVSRWRSGERPIPNYIVALMRGLMDDVELSLPLSLLLDMSDVAASEGITVKKLIMQAIRSSVSGRKPEPLNPPVSLRTKHTKTHARETQEPPKAEDIPA